MNRFKLAFSFPTFNRPDCIGKILELIVEKTFKLDIGIYIFDGSENDETETIVKNYINQGFQNIVYKRYPVDQTRQRLLDLFLIPDCEYLLVARDRSIVLPEHYELILNTLKQNWDIYFLFSSCQKNGISIYDSPVELFKDRFWDMSLYGSYIIKKSLLDKINKEITPQPFHSDFALLDYSFRAIASKDNFTALVAPFSKQFVVSDEHYISEAFGGDRLFLVWAKYWSDMIDDLPDIYEKYKKHVKKIVNSNTTLGISFSWLCQRITIGRIPSKHVILYRRDISKVSNVPIIVILLLTILPRPVVEFIRLLWRPLEIFCGYFAEVRYMIQKKLDLKKSL